MYMYLEQPGDKIRGTDVGNNWNKSYHHTSIQHVSDVLSSFVYVLIQLTCILTT